jgi:hypothetical protein
MRDLGKKETLEVAAGEALGKTLTVAQLDVCSDDSVSQCLSHIQGEVDVLGKRPSPWSKYRPLAGPDLSTSLWASCDPGEGGRPVVQRLGPPTSPLEVSGLI